MTALMAAVRPLDRTLGAGKKTRSAEGTTASVARQTAGAEAAAPSPTRVITYRDLERGDLPAAAALHRDVFRDYFLGHMGQRFLELFYGEFVSTPGNYGLVAVADDRIVGLVVGSTDLTRFYNDLYRRHFLALSWQFAVRFVRDRYIRGHVASRLQHVVKAVKSRLGVGKPSRPGPESRPQAQLLSVGVANSVRGMGVADDLTALFLDRLAAGGVDDVELSVRTDNPRAIAFYEKTGWTSQRAKGGSATFARHLQG